MRQNVYAALRPPTVIWLATEINVEGLSELSFKEQANAINSAPLKPLEEYRLPAPLERVLL